MEPLDALILGIIQGITEFLPVSSSGHLELAKSVLGAEGLAEQQLSFTVVLHFATALSTMVVFRKDMEKLSLEYSIEKILNLGLLHLKLYFQWSQLW